MESWVQWGIGIAFAVVVYAFKKQDDEIRRLDSEIKRLREWRHKVGDDPCHAIGKLYDILEKRVERIDKKVFNGHARD